MVSRRMKNIRRRDIKHLLFTATLGAVLAGASNPGVSEREGLPLQRSLWWFGVPIPALTPSVWRYDFVPLPLQPQITTTFAHIPSSCITDRTAFVQSSVHGAGPLLVPEAYPVEFMPTLAEAPVAGAPIGLATSRSVENIIQALADLVRAASSGSAKGLTDAGVPADQATAITVQAVASSVRSAMVSVAAEPNLPVELRSQVVSQVGERAVEVLGKLAPGASPTSINAAIGEISTAVSEAVLTAGISVVAAPEIVTAVQSVAALSTDSAQQTAVVQVAMALASRAPVAEVLASLPPELPPESPS